MARDFASVLLRKSIGALSSHRSSCCRCRRTPLPGELLHVFESGRALCTLCAARLPAGERELLRAERVHASEHHIAAVPRAA